MIRFDVLLMTALSALCVEVLISFCQKFVIHWDKPLEQYNLLLMSNFKRIF